MSYHTEGKGEDKVLPLQSVPVMLGMQSKADSADAQNFSNISSRITEALQINTCYNNSLPKYQENGHNLLEVDNAYEFSREVVNHSHGTATFGRQRSGIQNTTAMYDIALPDTFLGDYYSQKTACAVPVKDSILEFDFEGQDSSAGSVGCCSLLDSDNDLQFLNDLGLKFKTLTEICAPPLPKALQTSSVANTTDIVEPIVRSKSEQIVETSNTSVQKGGIMSSKSSKLSVSTVTNTSPSITLPHSKTANHHSDSCHHQSLMLQQPVYYTTNTVPQPLHYIVQPQIPNAIILAEGTHKANIPGLYVVSESQTRSGLVINGPQVSPSGINTQGTDSPKIPMQPSSPTSLLSPTLVLPGSQGLFKGSFPMDGWNIIGTNPDGNYIVIKKKNFLVEAENVDPGSSQGTLPRGATSVKEAVPPQGVLCPAAQETVYNNAERDRGSGRQQQIRDGHAGHTGSGLASVFKSNVEHLNFGIEHMLAGI
ncbi:desmoglein-2.1-like [Betta splendens]|nr:desmoglein-2.1-like [Betta splendens]